ncbi:hypothetical protein MMC11_000083 [Xylographa trunciseda]|nr:hypothetical protein [Xylographa trunciseda]
MSTNLRVLQIHWLPLFEDLYQAGATAWDVVTAIDVSDDGGLPSRSPVFWEWTMKILREDGFLDAPQMQDEVPAWRYVAPVSDYVRPQWQQVELCQAVTGVDERALKDRWHSYMMYVRCQEGCTYDEMLKTVSEMRRAGDMLTDGFLDWAMWELRKWLQEGRFERGFPSTPRYG